jgi:hypothetical protein
MADMFVLTHPALLLFEFEFDYFRQSIFSAACLSPFYNLSDYHRIHTPSFIWLYLLHPVIT